MAWRKKCHVRILRFGIMPIGIREVVTIRLDGSFDTSAWQIQRTPPTTGLFRFSVPNAAHAPNQRIFRASATSADVNPHLETR
jgi:hypothetical protein